MMIPDRLIEAFERMAEAAERSARVAETALELQQKTIDLGLQLQQEVDDTPEDVKLVADLRKRIAGLRKGGDQ